ncbi:MAG: hypothetical protein AAFX08_08370 [Pseudomonadota bacterium]
MTDRAEHNPAQSDSGRSRLEFDYQKYAHHLGDVDMSEAEKREYLQTLWNILEQFVDMGFGVHSAGPFGDVENNPAKLAPEAADRVHCKNRKNDIDEEDAPPGRKGSGARKTP